MSAYTARLEVSIMSRQPSFAAAMARAARDRERQQRARERETKARAKAAQAAHVSGREAEVESSNSDLSDTIDALGAMLTHGLAAQAAIDFSNLKKHIRRAPFSPGALATAEPTPTLDQYMPAPLGFLRGLLPGAKRSYERACELAAHRYDVVLKAHAERDAKRLHALAEAKQAHDADLDRQQKDADTWNAQVDDFAKTYAAADAHAVADYSRMVL